MCYVMRCIRPYNLIFMKYKVIFIQGEHVVTLVDNLIDVQACQFAINLHQSSNIVHVIKVVECDATASNSLLVLSKK